jgi:hypothetical protein
MPVVRRPTSYRIDMMLLQGVVTCKFPSSFLSICHDSLDKLHPKLLCDTELILGGEHTGTTVLLVSDTDYLLITSPT